MADLRGSCRRPGSWLCGAKYQLGPLCHLFKVAGTSGRKSNQAIDFTQDSKPNRLGARNHSEGLGRPVLRQEAWEPLVSESPASP